MKKRPEAVVKNISFWLVYLNKIIKNEPNGLYERAYKSKWSDWDKCFAKEMVKNCYIN
jgi:hypothetical protein